MVQSPSRPMLRARPVSPVTAAEVAAVRQPTVRASLMPPRVYHDPAVFQYEQEAWYGGDWVCVGRTEDAERTGQYFLATVAGESIIVVRGDDGELRAFYNVCRHRGATLVEEPCGALVRFQCPYHAWIYNLKGDLRPPRHTELLEDFDPAAWGLVPVPLAVWQGYIFLDLSGEAAPLAAHLGDLPGELARFDLGALRRARRIEYDVAANWKAIIENYEEYYHCPGVHPQLNRITPYNLGEWVDGDGPWLGSWMPVVGEFETLSMDGASHGRPPIAGTRDEDMRRIYYFVVWPNMLISLHPDYLMTHWLEPVAPGRTRIVCEWAFAAEAMAEPDFDPSDAVDFWDLTNRQDWHVCQLQQAGTRSRAYTAGRYSGIEGSVHGFDLMVADRYANDGIQSRVDRVTKDKSAGSTAGQVTRAKRADAAD
ncbi:MAG: aromatic ring-hydroxylating dioxygenase subunit alpha [Chloroflexia bacterium]|nr:aromatic ring-hydroxylating dioxygenase subunit alpha [Chloroflexia bacterium]